MNPLHPWLLLTIGPVMLTTFALIVLRRHGAWAMAAAVIVAAALLANAAIANSLTFVDTI